MWQGQRRSRTPQAQGGWLKDALPLRCPAVPPLSPGIWQSRLRPPALALCSWQGRGDGEQGPANAPSIPAATAPWPQHLHRHSPFNPRASRTRPGEWIVFYGPLGTGARTQIHFTCGEQPPDCSREPPTHAHRIPHSFSPRPLWVLGALKHFKASPIATSVAETFFFFLIPLFPRRLQDGLYLYHTFHIQDITESSTQILITKP